MSGFDADTLRDILRRAADAGVRYVRVREGDAKFEAVLPPVVELDEDEFELDDATPAVTPPKAVTTQLVGTFRAADDVQVGTVLEAGQRIGEVVALGISNEITTPVGGEVLELVTTDGARVDYGTTILLVKGE
jgi:biotin carboxyl carrier protein